MKTNLWAKTITMAAVLMLGGVQVTEASALTQGMKEFGRKIMGRGVQTAGEETVHVLVRGAQKYGDEGVEAVARYGKSALTAMRQTSDEGGVLLARMFNRYGPDAVSMAQSPAGRQILLSQNEVMIRAMIRHGDAAYPLLLQHGVLAGRALNNLSELQAARLVEMHRTGGFSRIQWQQILEVIGEYGDRALTFVWKHKGILIVGTILAQFYSDPEPFLNGTVTIATAAGRGVGQGMAEVGKVWLPLVNWNLWVGVLGGLLVIKWTFRAVWRRWRERRVERQAERTRKAILNTDELDGVHI